VLTLTVVGPSWNARPSKNCSKVVGKKPTSFRHNSGVYKGIYKAYIRPLYTPELCLMLVGFGCHCQYSLTAMNWLENSGSCVNTRLSFLNTGQQVAVFHSKLCPNLHTNHWSYLKVPSRALTKCTGCTCWVFKTCQHHLAYHSCERGHNMWPSNCQWLCDFTVHGVCEGVHRCLRVFMYMCVCVRVCCVVRMLCVLCMCVTCTYDIGCGGEFPQTYLTSISHLALLFQYQLKPSLPTRP